ncbi:MAG: DUF4214 domain-containing protein [Solobacterium sp.]|nr:DUF4214 domain-containing protein [Solobacterium sp.]
MKRFRTMTALLSASLILGLCSLPVNAENETMPEETEETTEITEEGYEDISDTEASIRGFVVRLYRVVLEREPDDSGYKTWTEGITDGSITGSTAVKGFFLSKEMNARNLDNETFVRLLYKAVLNRDADATGLKDWTDRLNVLMTREFVINGFLNSTEFGNLCSTYGVTKGNAGSTGLYRDRNYQITAFVYRLYTKVLGRGAEVGGLEGWTKKVYTEGMTGADLAVGFFLSPEYTNKNTSNEQYVKTLYQTVLNREGSAQEISSWVSYITSGKTRKETLAGFVNSAEFGKLCEQYGIERGTLVLEGWKNINGKLYYYKGDGKKASKEILNIGGKLYGFNIDGLWIGDKSADYLNAYRKAIALVDEITDPSMTKAQKLRVCFDVFPTLHFRERNPWIPHYLGDDWVEKYANHCFDNRSGNCMSYAACFALMAQVIGYEEIYCSNSTGHGWVEIAGLVYDPQWTLHYSGNFFARELSLVTKGDPLYEAWVDRSHTSNLYVRIQE